MKKYNMSKIFKNAWKMVKENKMSMSTALKKAWAEAKSAVKKGMSVADYLVSLGYKIWEKGIFKRIYVDSIEPLMIKFGKDSGLAKAFRRVGFYYDCKTDSFVTTAKRSAVKNTEEVIAAIKANAANA